MLVRQVQQRRPVCSQRNGCFFLSGESPQPCMCPFGGRYLGLRDHSGQCFGAGGGVEDGRQCELSMSRELEHASKFGPLGGEVWA
jgi:hypothetical protein